MPLSIGIVGLPNVGKSTLFQALTKKAVEAANYPFCTIDPNVGVVKVPDERLARIAAISRPQKIIPTTIEFTDIAGLVKGAHQGEGLGNKFLSHIRECDAICEVVRDFEDKDIVHVEGRIDVEADRETVNLELIFADLDSVEKKLARTEKEAKSGNKTALEEKTLLEKCRRLLAAGEPLRQLELTEEEAKLLKGYGLLTLKPIIYVVNTDRDFTPPSSWDGQVLALNVKLEEEIAGLPEGEQKEYIEELGLKQSGLDKLIRAAYDLLGLLTFFTTGSDETRAWTVKRGAKAPQAAGVIHTDFEKGFIRAEVIGYKDFLAAGSEQAAREKGWLRTEGKDYVIEDGNICHFLFNK